jgi:hypothetical protein
MRESKKVGGLPKPSQNARKRWVTGKCLRDGVGDRKRGSVELRARLWYTVHDARSREKVKTSACQSRVIMLESLRPLGSASAWCGGAKYCEREFRRNV